MLRDAMTGLATLACAAGLLVMLMLFGELRGVGEKTYALTLKMPSVMGLSGTAPVTLNGVRVGTVEKMAPLSDPSQGVEVTLRVQEQYKIPVEASAYIDKGFVGDSVLEFTASSASGAGGFMEPGTVYAKQAQTFFDRLMDPIREPLSNLSGTARSIDAMAVRFEAVGAQLEEMLRPRTVADVQAGQVPNVRSTLARLDTALASLDRWFSDDAMLEQARKAAADLADFAKQASEAAAKTAPKVDRAVDALIAALGKVEETAGQLSQIAVAINQGKGTAGQLVTNPDLYNSLSDTAQRLDRTLQELELLIKQVRTEGLPIGL